MINQQEEEKAMEDIAKIQKARQAIRKVKTIGLSPDGNLLMETIEGVLKKMEEKIRNA